MPQPIHSKKELLALVVSLSSDYKEKRYEAFEEIRSGFSTYCVMEPLDYITMMQFCKGLYILLWKEDGVDRQIEIAQQIGALCASLPCDGELDSDDLPNAEAKEENEEMEDEDEKEDENNKIAIKIIKINDEEKKTEKDNVLTDNEENKNENKKNDNDDETEINSYGGQFILYWRCWLETLCREYTNVDYHRISKVMGLIRYLLQAFMVRVLSESYVSIDQLNKIYPEYEVSLKEFESTQPYCPYLLGNEFIKKAGTELALKHDISKTWNFYDIVSGEEGKITELTAFLATLRLVILSNSRIKINLTPLSLMFCIAEYWVDCLKFAMEKISYIGCYVTQDQFAEMTMTWVEYYTQLSEKDKAIIKRLSNRHFDTYFEGDQYEKPPLNLGAYIGKDYLGMDEFYDVEEEQNDEEIEEAEEKKENEDKIEKEKEKVEVEEKEFAENLEECEEEYGEEYGEEAGSMGDEENKLSLPQMIYLIIAGTKNKAKVGEGIRCRSKEATKILEKFAINLIDIREEWNARVSEDSEKITLEMLKGTIEKEKQEEKDEKDKEDKEEEEEDKKEKENIKKEEKKEDKKNKKNKKDKKDSNDDKYIKA